MPTCGQTSLPFVSTLQTLTLIPLHFDNVHSRGKALTPKCPHMVLGVFLGANVYHMVTQKNPMGFIWGILWNEYAKVEKFQGRILSSEIVVFRQYFWAGHWNTTWLKNFSSLLTYSKIWLVPHDYQCSYILKLGDKKIPSLVVVHHCRLHQHPNHNTLHILPNITSGKFDPHFRKTHILHFDEFGLKSCYEEWTVHSLYWVMWVFNPSVSFKKSFPWSQFFMCNFYLFKKNKTGLSQWSQQNPLLKTYQ
jgi:hypothetical protein